ncbi:MAG: YgfZ/GcvT domain-containing protein [Acidobacteriaceae bacterium]
MYLLKRRAMAAMSDSTPNSSVTISTRSTIQAPEAEGPPMVESGLNAEDPIAPITPLTEALRASAPLRLQQYRGVQTVQTFSNAPDELAALLAAAGVYDLGWKRFVRCTGEDRLRWLNGMVTNFITALEENAGCYAFVLNAQGRIQGDLDIYRRADCVWLATDATQAESLTALLAHYIIMDDVTMEPQPAWTAIGIAGPLAANKLAAAGLPAAPSSLHIAEADWRGHPIIVVATYSPLVPRYEVWAAREHARDLWNALTDEGTVPCGATSLEQLRIIEGTPAYSIDINDKALPQETNQMRALHFAKGCYLGQEIVERIRSRGNVHRTFSGFILADAEPAAGTPLVAEGKPVGEITSVSRIAIPGVGERVLALGNVRREALDRGLALTANETAATPSSLPFVFTGNASQP